MTLGQNIKKYRTKAGLQQKDLAAMVAKSATSIMRYEKDEREPGKETLEKIATALNVNPTLLMDWESWNETFNVQRLSEESKTLDSVGFLFGMDSVKILEMFCNLNDDGQKKALENLEDLTLIPKYKKED